METVHALAAVMSQDVHRSALTAINVANIATPGFKRIFADASDGSIQRDLTPGKALVTGRPLDVYLSDGIFLEVTKDGVSRYTRGGSLQINSEGQLVTPDNWLVSVTGLSGALPSSLSVASSGALESGGKSVGQLVLVSGQGARIDSSGYFTLESTHNSIPVGAVQGGAVESSNVRLTDEIVDMMRHVRHMDSVQRVLRQQEVLNERVFSMLAKF